MNNNLKKLIALVLCVLMAVGSVAAASSEGSAQHSVYVMGGDASFNMDDTLTLTVGSDAVVDSCQWQIYVPAQGVWANIYGKTGADLVVDYAMVASLLSGDSAQIRCKAMIEGEEYFTAPATVSVNVQAPVSEPAAPQSPVVIQQATPVGEAVVSAPVTGNAPVEAAADEVAQMDEAVAAVAMLDDIAPLADEIEDPQPSEPVLTTHVISINYVLEDGTVAAPPFTAQVQHGSSYYNTVKSPVVMGYAPVDAEKTIDLNYDSVEEDITIAVTYHPALVDFTVNHYQQNLDDNNYTLFDTVTVSDHFTGTVVGPGLANTYEGFVALLYDETTKVAADGSTVVNIYYDRQYYLMTFDLAGGYGTEPIYARYGSPVQVNPPLRDGYVFTGWTPTVPSIVPANDTVYTAGWTSNSVNYTVVYWAQNADDNGYSYWGSTTRTAQAGSKVNGTNDAPPNLPDFKRFAFKEFDQNVTVAGDGSTVVNVYYDRKVYTLQFIYARSRTQNGQTTYNVVGGSTYAFSTTDSTNVSDLLDGISSDNWGTLVSPPVLNANGLARNYNTGIGSYSIGRTTYNYYYIEFSARYGADISGLWPVDVFDSNNRTGGANGSWNDTTTYVAGWNPEHHVKYSRDQATSGGNYTVKGSYLRLDDDLLYASNYSDASTVKYICFWENGAVINWSVPEEYIYNLYVPVLPGVQPDKIYNGIGYKLHSTSKTIDDSDVAHQTATGIPGFNNIGRDGNQNFHTPPGVKESWTVDFYYSRNSYDLIFNNGGNVEKTEKVPYETLLSNKYYEPTQPDEAKGLVFAGWSTSPLGLPGTMVDFSTQKMPFNNLALYAIWVPTTHTVTTRLTESEIECIDTWTVPHGSVVPTAPQDPTNGDYEFVGWFYKDNGVEKAFDFTMTVQRDMDLYAKWRSNKIMPITIHYVTVVNGEEITIADDTTSSGLAGTTKTFEAKGGADLYEGYQEGYFPETSSHNVEINIEGVNEYTFVYVPKEEVNYTVKYFEEGTNAVLHEQKAGKTSHAVITEEYERIVGYRPDAFQKRLVLSANENENVLIFYYVKDEVHAPVQITHYTENATGGGYTVYQDETNLDAIIGQTYNATAISIPGFTFDGTIEGTLVEGTLTAAGLHLKLYYTRNFYPYEFRFLEQGTDTKLADPVSGTAKYQTSVTESAKTIPGYTLVSDSQQQIVIKIEDGETAVKNVATFYYTENEVNINYEVVGPNGCGTVAPASETVKAVTGTAVGSTATANENYRFVGWFLDKACTQPVTETWVTDGKIVPEKTGDLWTAATYYAKFEYDLTTLTIKKTCMNPDESAIFTVTGKGFENGVRVAITNGDSVTIAGVYVGEKYTIVEDGRWSWRYMVATTETNELVPVSNEICVNNIHNNGKWLGGEDYVKNLLKTILSNKD